MARNLCDFYVFKSPTQLAAKYVNAVLSQVEAQSTANALLKQYGAQFVCGINKGGASGPPRAPIKSGAAGVPAVGSLPACWVYAGNPEFHGAGDYEMKTTPFERSKPLVSHGEMPHQGPLVPAMSTSFLRPSTTPVASVRLAGAPEEGDGALGSVVINYILVAWKGNKILKQWGVDRTYTHGISFTADKPTLYQQHKEMLDTYWPSAKKLGATSLCVNRGYPEWLCYNGISYTEGLASGMQQSAQMGIQCPQGQVWDNTTKKCVSAQSNADYGTPSTPSGEAFKRPALTSRGEQPHQGPLTTKLNTSFMRPQRVAGIEEQPMFRWIEKKPVRDERAIEARLHGIGRDDEDESGELGRSYAPGARPGPQTDYSNYPMQQKQPKLLTKPGQIPGGKVELKFFEHQGASGGYIVLVNDKQAYTVQPGGSLTMAYYMQPTAQGNVMMIEIVVNRRFVVMESPMLPGMTLSVLIGVKKLSKPPGRQTNALDTTWVKKSWALAPDGKTLIEVDYVANYNAAGQELSGPQVGLGAVPWQVARWFSSNVKDWDQMSSEQQQSLLSAAKAKEAAFQGYLQQFRSQGACDGTKPGLMAGALKEKLIASGADKTKLDADDSVFGPGECAEWYRIFGANPTVGDAAAAWQFGGNTFGGVQITYKDVCPSPKLPVCPPPGGGSAPPGGGGGGVIDPCKDVTCMSGQKCVDGKCVPVPSETKKTNWGLILLGLAAGGGLIAAAASAAMPKAPKLPPREADRLKANKRGCANC